MKGSKWIRVFLILGLCIGVFFIWRFNYNGIRFRWGTDRLAYYKHGRVDECRNGLIQEDGVWWYLKHGWVDQTFEGLVPYEEELWRVSEGTVDRKYQGFDSFGPDWWYVKDGKVQKNLTGLIYGMIPADGLGMISGRDIPAFPGYFSWEISCQPSWWYVCNGKVMNEDTTVQKGAYWWRVNKGRVQFSYQGVGRHKLEKVYFSNGHVDFEKDGVYHQNDCTYLLQGGKVQSEIRVDSTRFVAHRGFSVDAPDNTRKAFELAGEAGFWGCETDVRLTSDGQFVLLHGKTFDRMCGIGKSPQNMSAEEIRKLQIIWDRKSEEYAQMEDAIRIAFLEEYLQICLKYQMVPVMDIKITSSGDESVDYQRMESLYQNVKEIMGDLEVVFISTDISMLRQLRHIMDNNGDKNAKIQILINNVNQINAEEFHEMDLTIDIKYAALQEHTIEELHEAGFQVNVWTVDDVYKIDFLLRQKVDYITTNKKQW